MNKNQIKMNQIHCLFAHCACASAIFQIWKRYIYLICTLMHINAAYFNSSNSILCFKWMLHLNLVPEITCDIFWDRRYWCNLIVRSHNISNSIIHFIFTLERMASANCIWSWMKYIDYDILNDHQSDDHLPPSIFLLFVKQALNESGSEHIFEKEDEEEHLYNLGHRLRAFDLILI